MTERTAKARILVVDDDGIILDSLCEYLRLEKYAVRSAASFPEAVQALDEETFDLIVSDINLPGGDGFELLHVAKKKAPQTVTIMMTGYGTIESAVEAIRMGAYDYLTKPIVDEDILLCVERALTQQMLVRENHQLKERLGQRYGLSSVVGHDYRMLKVFDLIDSVADAKVTVLIQGDSGTGKSLVAGVIHQQSDRRNAPFVEVSCGAIPEALLESELFGHVRGAFTGAVANKTGKFKAADGGTIFLDEIAAASPALQVKLLRTLQSHEFEPVGSNKTESVDVRVILATNVNLEAEVAAGRFREDLFYRINVITLTMPVLKERVSDIPLLAKHFLEKYASESKRQIYDITDDALAVLQRYDWPGNVRELENAIERAVVLAKGRQITVNDLPPKIVAGAPTTPPAVAVYEPRPLREALERPEKEIIEAALRANGWNRQRTAEQLEINRTTLYKKMKHHGLEPEASQVC